MVLLLLVRAVPADLVGVVVLYVVAAAAVDLAAAVVAKDHLAEPAAAVGVLITQELAR